MTVVVLSVLATHGCVAMTDPANYRPVVPPRDQVYYECYRQAQQPQASASQVYASANYELNHDMLEHCMRAQGFRLRSPTTGEMIFGLVTAPIWFPIGLFTGIKPFKISGGGGGK